MQTDKIRRHSLFFIFHLILICCILSVPKNLHATVPVQIRINISKTPPDAIKRQIKLLKDLAGFFSQNNIKGGFWFSGAAYRQITKQDHALIRHLYNSHFLIGHHGANRGNKGERLIDTLVGLEWDKAVSQAYKYESKENGGGLLQMQKDFGFHINVTGRFFLAPILQADKLAGCQAMIGLKQLHSPTNAAWYMGMFNLPDRVTIMPSEIRSTLHYPHRLEKKLKQITNNWPTKTIETLSILIHGKDFFQGSLNDQQQFMNAFKSLLMSISANKKFQTVTFNDLIKMVSDDRKPTLQQTDMAQAARQLVKNGSLPLYINIDGRPLSLTDIFYGFAQAIYHYNRFGQLPESVHVPDLLGPVRFQQAASTTTVTSIEFTDVLSKWLQSAPDRIPSFLTFNKIPKNAASILFSMAELYDVLYRGHPLQATISIPKINMFQQQTKACPDTLSRLQFWTYKPQRLQENALKIKTIRSGTSPKKLSRTKTPLYVTLFSHNEEGAPWKNLINDKALYIKYRENLARKIRFLHKTKTPFSWQTDYPVLLAMVKYEKDDLIKSTNNKNILRWMSEDMDIEITPHSHLGTYNYADIVHLIKQLGVTPAPVIGGFSLYTCDTEMSKATGMPPIQEINWRQELSINPHDTIKGRIFPQFSWAPEILTQPAMIGHIFGEYSSGIWKPAKNDFTKNDPNGKLLVIGQGYPHYMELIGQYQPSGAKVVSNHLGYIREMTKELKTNKNLQGRFYSASIHTRDYPKTRSIDTLSALKKTLEALRPLINSGQVILKNYTDASVIWRQQFHAVPNRFPITMTSLYKPLLTEVRHGCSNRKTYQNRNKCGDGICDDYEKRSGKCQLDCFQYSRLSTGQPTKKFNSRLCGDGICDEHEKTSGMCRKDCR